MWTPPVAGLRHSGCPGPGPGSPGVPSCRQQRLQYLLPSLVPELLASLAWCLLVIAHWHTHPHHTYLLQFLQLLAPWTHGPLWPVAPCPVATTQTPHTLRSLQLLPPRALGPLGLVVPPQWGHLRLRTLTCTLNKEPLTQEISQRWNLIRKQDTLCPDKYTDHPLPIRNWVLLPPYPPISPPLFLPHPPWFNLSAIMTSVLFLISMGRCDFWCLSGVVFLTQGFIQRLFWWYTSMCFPLLTKC